MNTLLLTTAYFPPVQYFSKIKHHDTIFIEQYENYGKQSYRNRCRILSANGPLDLSIPIKKNNQIKFLTREAEPDYSVNWQKLHFKSIESAYKNSPFYDYYEEYLINYFEKKEKYLLDLNTKILYTLLDLLQLKKKIQYTDDYVREPEKTDDFRTIIHPKPTRRSGEDLHFKPVFYAQTFSEKFSFVPNLSVIDLLFNTGPDAQNYL